MHDILGNSKKMQTGGWGGGIRCHLNADHLCCIQIIGLLVAQMVKNLPAVQEIWLHSLGGKIPWRWAWQPTPVFLPGELHGPWTEEPGGLQSVGSQRVRPRGVTDRRRNRHLFCLLISRRQKPRRLSSRILNFSHNIYLNLKVPERFQVLPQLRGRFAAL